MTVIARLINIPARLLNIDILHKVIYSFTAVLKFSAQVLYTVYGLQHCYEPVVHVGCIEATTHLTFLSGCALIWQSIYL